MSVRYNTQIKDIRQRVSLLLKNIVESNNLSLEAYEANDTQKFKEVQRLLGDLYVQGDTIDNEIVKTFALFDPEANELRALVAYLKMTNEIVRIGEGVKKYSRRIKEHLDGECDLQPLSSTIVQLHKSTINALNYILECFDKFEEVNVEDYYRKVMVEESKSDDLFAIIEKEIMTILIDEKELVQEYVKVLGTLRKLERSCDRSVNIANLMTYAKVGGEMTFHS